MKRAAIALALALAASLTLTACSSCTGKSDGNASGGATTAAVPRCPAGSSLDTTQNCKGTGAARVATLAWNQTIGDSAQTFTLRNVSGHPLKNGTVLVWCYDKSGTRLDIAGAKKYAVLGDAFGGPVRPGESRDLSVNLPRMTLPDGTATLEAEVVKVTLVNRDGTDGMNWSNDDLDVDDRASQGVPTATRIVPVLRPGTSRPGHRPAPPPPPPPRQ
jgi:hypothetical protein